MTIKSKNKRIKGTLTQISKLFPLSSYLVHHDYGDSELRYHKNH